MKEGMENRQNMQNILKSTKSNRDVMWYSVVGSDMHGSGPNALQWLTSPVHCRDAVQERPTQVVPPDPQDAAGQQQEEGDDTAGTEGHAHPDAAPSGHERQTQGG